MKKAIFALTFIVVSAITASALAYKASRLGTIFYVNNISNKCVSSTVLNYIADLAGTSTTNASTSSSPLGCGRL